MMKCVARGNDVEALILEWKILYDAIPKLDVLETGLDRGARRACRCSRSGISFRANSRRDVRYFLESSQEVCVTPIRSKE